MLVQGETFPYRPITELETERITSCCGGRPIEDKESVRNFLGVSGRPLVEPYPIMPLVMNAKNATVKAVDLRSPTATLSFNRGAYLYAGMLREITGITAIPFEPSVVLELDNQTEADPLDLALEIYQLGREIPSLGRVLGEIGPVLIGDHPHDTYAVLMGAGVVHKIVTETVDVRQDFSGFSM